MIVPSHYVRGLAIVVSHLCRKTKGSLFKEASSAEQVVLIILSKRCRIFVGYPLSFFFSSRGGGGGV